VLRKLDLGVVVFWPLAEIQKLAIDVCFRGKSGQVRALWN
jgi:hypothetical protein